MEDVEVTWVVIRQRRTQTDKNSFSGGTAGLQRALVRGRWSLWDPLPDVSVRGSVCFRFGWRVALRLPDLHPARRQM